MLLKRFSKAGYSVLHIAGSVIDLNSRTELSKKLNSLVSDVNCLALNIEKLKRPSSQLLGIFFVTYRAIKKKGGKMGLIAPDKHVEDLLNITSMNKIIPVYDTEEDFKNDIYS